MTTMYQLRWAKIEPFEVLRTTEKQVVLASPRKGGEERQAKETEWYTWHDTWEEAHARAVANAQRKVDSLRKQLERANGELGNAKGMKPPNTKAKPTREAGSA